MDTAIQVRHPWNKGLIVGQKRPLLPRQVWSIRVRLEMSGSARDLALFNLAIDSKLRASDLVRLKVEDVCSGPVVRDRAIITQLKTATRSVRDHRGHPAVDRTAASSTSFEADRMIVRTSRRGSMPASSVRARSASLIPVPKVSWRSYAQAA